MGLADWTKKLYDDKFKRYTILAVIILGTLVFLLNMDYYTSVSVGGSKPSLDSIQTTIHLPWLGEIDALSYSLPVLAIILGLIDGFNPCAMWVLVYLISIVAGLNDRRKIWFIVGSFVFASGVLYFLFMTLWLNAFLAASFITPVTLLLGIVALATGVIDLRTYFTTKGALVCDVGDVKSKQKTMNKIKEIVQKPLTLFSVFGIIVLAFIVNSVEFLCSGAIPLVFTKVLTLSNLATWQYYAYILLYDFFFMLDDLLIFGMAAFAVNSSLGDKYAKYCKLLGGAILILLGALMLFFPSLLI